MHLGVSCRVGEECLELELNLSLPFRGFKSNNGVREGFKGFFNCGKIGHGGDVADTKRMCLLQRVLITPVLY